jgi:hypothetical protein
MSTWFHVQFYEKNVLLFLHKEVTHHSADGYYVIDDIHNVLICYTMMSSCTTEGGRMVTVVEESKTISSIVGSRRPCWPCSYRYTSKHFSLFSIKFTGIETNRILFYCYIMRPLTNYYLACMAVPGT